MFVSKKNVIYFNKPKTIDPSKPPRVLPGINVVMKDGSPKNK